LSLQTEENRVTIVQREMPKWGSFGIFWIFRYSMPLESPKYYFSQTCEKIENIEKRKGNTKTDLNQHITSCGMHPGIPEL
jgi:hypothetical protein